MARAFARSLILLLALCWLEPAGGTASAAEAAKPAAMIIDANTGKVLHNQAGDEPRFPASLTKMMTLYMLFGEIEQGRLDYQSKIRISERATTVAPSKLGLEAGEEIAVIDAIKALITKSANDIAVAIAEHIGGNEYQFARLMTERAHQIGMRSTTFRNASGLPNPNQVTTARDMLTLALRLQEDFPQHYPLFATAAFTYRGKTYKTHNTLMRGFPGMDGVKTGYTRASGFNLVSSVRVNGKHVVGAVFGGKTAAARNAHMRALLYAALEKAATQRTRPSGPQLVASARPALRTAAAAPLEAASATETKRRAAAATPKAPPVKVAAAVPPPVLAVRPARDQIAQVLDQGDTAEAGAEEPAAPVAPPPRLDLEALRAAMSEAGTEAPPPAAPARADAATAPADIAGLIRNSIVESASAAEAQGPAANAAGLARAPSTLEAQASALATPASAAGGMRLADAGKGPAPSYLKGPAAETQFAAAPLGAGYEIQIGAYSTAAEAQAKLATVRGRAAGLLDGHDGVTLPVQKAERQIFRARFVRFDEGAASNACLELRRLAIDCFVMKAD